MNNLNPETTYESIGLDTEAIVNKPKHHLTMLTSIASTLVSAPPLRNPDGTTRKTIELEDLNEIFLQEDGSIEYIEYTRDGDKTIHMERFQMMPSGFMVTQTAKATTEAKEGFPQFEEQILNENKEEFANLYIRVFAKVTKELEGRLKGKNR